MDKFKQTVLKIWVPVKTKVSSIDKKVKIGVAAGVAAVIIALIIFAIIMGQTNYSVLYSDVESAEMTEITQYINNELGITDIKIQGNDILVPSPEVENIRVKLSIAGYPKTTYNYDIWKNGISMFSTQTEILETQKQQLEANLMSTFRQFEGVNSAIVKLNIPEDSNYVISTSEKKSSAGVVLQLKNEITQEQIDGMYNLVANSVPGLEIENITITDGTGSQLYYDGGTLDNDSTDDETARLQLYYKRNDYRNSLEETMETAVSDLLDGLFDEIRVQVALELNYDKQVTEKTDYTPSVDEDGTAGGMIDEETYSNAAGGVAEDGGLVGTTVDADISPDYPTLTVGEDGQFYYESSRTIHHLVNEEKTQIEKDGYTIQNLTAAVTVDDDQITTQEKEELANAIALAIGAEPANVTVVGRKFIDNSIGDFSGDDITIGSSNMNNAILLSVIIVLGVVLIVLLFLALSASGSKKKKRYSHAMGKGTAKARPEFVATGAEGEPMKQETTTSPAAARNAIEVVQQDFELHSLSDDVPETRDGALKREIRDFSKQNPEIVAQLLRTWMRGDE